MCKRNSWQDHLSRRLQAGIGLDLRRLIVNRRVLTLASSFISDSRLKTSVHSRSFAAQVSFLKSAFTRTNWACFPPILIARQTWHTSSLAIPKKTDIPLKLLVNFLPLPCHLPPNPLPPLLHPPSFSASASQESPKTSSLPLPFKNQQSKTLNHQSLPLH